MGQRTTLQYQLDKPGGGFSLVEEPYPNLRSNEVAIRNKAVALNPLDWKSRLFGILVNKWPAVIGIDSAGVVESVGKDVQNFKPGDEVFALGGFDDMGNRSGAYQEVMVVPSHFVGRKPLSMSFADASSLPVCYLTAVDALNVGLRLPLPTGQAVEAKDLKTVFILGGSSCVGAALIQLLRVALPSVTILTTSSPKHHQHLIALGATKCFDRSAQSDVSEVKAETPHGGGVDAIVDCVAAAATQPNVFAALGIHGPKIYSQVVTGSHVTVPEGINASLAYAKNAMECEGGTGLMDALANLLESGMYKVPVKVEIVGTGFRQIEQGLDLLMKGVSGLKYAVTVD